MFVYDAVRELLLLGDTSIKANDLKSAISQLKSTSDGRSSYQQQFDVSAWLTASERWVHYNIFCTVLSITILKNSIKYMYSII